MRIFLALLLLSLGFTAHTQQPEDSVKKVVNSLFTAMKTSDKALFRECFTDSAILQTVKSTGVNSEPVSQFIDQISKLPKGAADERITFGMIKIDGDLASVWTPYQFYYNGKFSHCGANSFQLVRLAGQWKIQYVIDTRRKQNCLK